jgi:pSer/pThr/pTyr-binding forkhead associated (FHA) protein
MSFDSVLIEILDSHGRVQTRERIALSGEQRTFTIGRSVTADVTLDDAHAAALHASVEITPQGTILVSDLGSVNGVVVAGKRHRDTGNTGDSKHLAIADGMLQIGRTRLRVRTVHESLAPEKPDQLRPSTILRDPAWIAGAGALVGGVQLAYSGWLGAPRDLATIIVTTLISGVLAAGAWVAFWALLTRVMQGEWRWLRHAAIFLGVAAVFVAIDGVLELGWFVFSFPQWSTRAAWVGAVAFGCALYLHLMHASNLSARRAALLACIVPALSGGTGQWVQARYQMRDVNHIATSVRLYPPSLRLRAAGTAEDYFRDAAALRDTADRMRKAIRADDEDDESSDDE